MKNFELYKENIIAEATYIINTRCTIRQAAKKFSMSKSGLHDHMSKQLLDIDPILQSQVQEIFDQNYQERNIRGGRAFKKKIEAGKVK